MSAHSAPAVEAALMSLLNQLDRIMAREAAYRRSEAGRAAEARFQEETQKRADFCSCP